MNFELILFWITVVGGAIVLFDFLFLRKKRIGRHVELGITGPLKYPMLIDYARSFFPILLTVLILRSFIYEPFRIPSGSLEPTLQVGDFILVNKYAYGLRLPVLHKKIYSMGEPKRGNIAVFRWPPDPSIDYIKRIIGLPGDKISYINKVLYVNGMEIKQEFIEYTDDSDGNGHTWKVKQNSENLTGVKHDIFLRPDVAPYNLKDIVVPEGYYFAMGDNRDDSSDSRYWGFVSEKNLVGKAVLVWLSWDGKDHNLRLDRIGKRIN